MLMDQCEKLKVSWCYSVFYAYKFLIYSFSNSKFETTRQTICTHAHNVKKWFLKWKFAKAHKSGHRKENELFHILVPQYHYIFRKMSNDEELLEGRPKLAGETFQTALRYKNEMTNIEVIVRTLTRLVEEQLGQWRKKKAPEQLSIVV